VTPFGSKEFGEALSIERLCHWVGAPCILFSKLWILFIFLDAARQESPEALIWREVETDFMTDDEGKLTRRHRAEQPVRERDEKTVPCPLTRGVELHGPFKVHFVRELTSERALCKPYKTMQEWARILGAA
jgi:hypothetical protein